MGRIISFFRIISTFFFIQIPSYGGLTYSLAGEQISLVYNTGNKLTLLPDMKIADMDNDLNMEEFSLENKNLQLFSKKSESEKKILWSNPEGWRILQAAFTDLNRDNKPEITLLVWRAFRPWPVDRFLPNGGRISTFHDKEGDSCQLILIGWERGAYREVWAGSALAEPIRQFLSGDFDGDGLEELATIEFHYDDPAWKGADLLKIWKWNGFGFTLLSKTEGRFWGMKAARAENLGKILIYTY